MTTKLPTKIPNTKRDAVWARAMAATSGTQTAEMRQPDYWLDWLDGCREAGLGQTGMKRLLAVHFRPLHDTTAVDFIADVLNEEVWDEDAVALIAVYVRSTGRAVEAA